MISWFFKRNCFHKSNLYRYSKDVHFVSAAATQAGAGFYLVTAQFLDKVYPLIEKGGFHFVDEWLVRWGCTS